MACTKNERYDISPKSSVAWENITGGLEFDSFYIRPRHSAWKNGCDRLIVVGLYKDWTLAIRFQVSGFSREKARASLTPDT
jgi:hypothetical protein